MKFCLAGAIITKNTSLTTDKRLRMTMALSSDGSRCRSQFSRGALAAVALPATNFFASIPFVTKKLSRNFSRHHGLKISLDDLGVISTSAGFPGGAALDSCSPAKRPGGAGERARTLGGALGPWTIDSSLIVARLLRSANFYRINQYRSYDERVDSLA